MLRSRPARSFSNGALSPISALFETDVKTCFEIYNIFSTTRENY